MDHKNKSLIWIIAIIIVALIVAGISYYFLSSRQNNIAIEEGGTGTVNDKNAFDYCDNNEDCVWYIENQGDPAGQIHCAGLNYSKTCGSCEKLTGDELNSLPSNLKCSCSTNNFCQKSQ